MEPITIELTAEQRERLALMFQAVKAGRRDNERVSILAQVFERYDMLCYLIDGASASKILEITTASIKILRQAAEKKARLERLKSTLNVSRIINSNGKTLTFIHEGFEYVVTEKS